MLNPISFRHRFKITIRIFKQWQHPGRANHLRSTYRTSRHAIKRKIVPHPSFARITRTFPDCRISLWNLFQRFFAIIHDFYPLCYGKTSNPTLFHRSHYLAEVLSRPDFCLDNYWANFHYNCSKKRSCLYHYNMLKAAML